MRDALAESSLPLSDVDEEDIDLGERNIKQCKRKIFDGHYTAPIRALSSLVVAPYNEATLEDLNTKHLFKPPPSLPHISIDHHLLVASPAEVLERIKSFPRGTSRGRDGLRTQNLMDWLSGATVAISGELVSSITQVVNLFLDGKCLNRLGEYIASAPLTLLVKLGGGTRHIVMGTILRRVVSKVSVIMIGYSLASYLDVYHFGVGVAVEVRIKRLCYVKFVSVALLSHVGENFVTLTQLDCITRSTPYGRAKECNKPFLHALYLDEGTFIGDMVAVGKVLELIIEDGSGFVLHINVDKTKGFWPKENPRSRLAGIFSPNIALPLHGALITWWAC
nr:hypothetical protein [Tanacetum cinerariifolium]